MDDCIYYMLIDNYFQLPRTMEKTFPVYNEYIYNESNVNLPSELISVLKLSFFLCLLAVCILFSCYSISYYSFIQCCDMYSYNNTYSLCKYLHDEFNLATATELCLNSHISLLLNSEIFFKKHKKSTTSYQMQCLYLSSNYLFRTAAIFHLILKSVAILQVYYNILLLILRMTLSNTLLVFLLNWA